MDDYVVGNVADLIAGNLTPSRPANMKRPRTPVKHQPSPRVTPRSESLPGRESLLSPTLLRKKAVAKKSPKRIFEREDLDKIADETASLKTDKVKKHLQADLDGRVKYGGNSYKHKVDSGNANNEDTAEVITSSKKKKNKKFKQNVDDTLTDQIEKNAEEASKENKNASNDEEICLSNKQKKKNRKAKDKSYKQHNPTELVEDTMSTQDNEYELKTPLKFALDKKGKKKKNKKKLNKENKNKKEKSKRNEDVDRDDGSASEHESDNEIESETEQDVKQILDCGPVEGEDSSDDEKQSHKQTKKKPKIEKKNGEKSKVNESTETQAEEAKRTLFVGNVPLTKKTKKEIKQIFSKYGTIESVRIRAVPVKDMRTNPKVAVIKNEIHPDRSSVNVYVKFSDVSSVSQALFENNRLLGEHHLRVTRSDTTGDISDPRRTIFVGNIPFGIEDETLRAKFDKCGDIESVRIIRDKASQIGKGFGYVNFASMDGVELALSLTEEDLTIKNRIMRIRRYTQATPGQKVISRPQKPQFSRGQQHNRGQGHFGNRGLQDNRNQTQFGNRSRQDSRDRGQFGNRGHQDNRNQGQHGSRDNRDNEAQGYQSNRGNQDSREFNKRSFSGKPKDDSGALRRIKRKIEDVAPSSEAPQKKTKGVEQPLKQKKSKKDFVGMTAEKKKKKKFDKGRKQKQKLSEILTK